MGKGGTGFHDQQIGHRAGRSRSGYSKKEISINLEEYKRTGKHPELERLQARQLEPSRALPESDASKTHVFFSLAYGGKAGQQGARKGGEHIGKIVVEVFDEVGEAERFANGCAAMAGPHSHSYEGESVSAVVDDFYIQFGRAKSDESDLDDSHGQQCKYSHVEAGLVSLLRGSFSFMILLGEMESLDQTNVVVGRIVEGEAVLKKLSSTRTEAIVVSECGKCHGRAVSLLKGGGETLLEKKGDEAAEAATDGVDIRESVQKALTIKNSNLTKATGKRFFSDLSEEDSSEEEDEAGAQ